MKTDKGSSITIETYFDQLDSFLQIDDEDQDKDLFDLDKSMNSTYLEEIRTGKAKNFDQMTECPHCGTATPIKIDPQGRQSFHCRECGMNI